MLIRRCDCDELNRQVYYDFLLYFQRSIMQKKCSWRLFYMFETMINSQFENEKAYEIREMKDGIENWLRYH